MTLNEFKFKTYLLTSGFCDSDITLITFDLVIVLYSWMALSPIIKFKNIFGRSFALLVDLLLFTCV